MLSAALCASALTWLVFRATAHAAPPDADPGAARRLGDAGRPRRAGRPRSRPLPRARPTRRSRWSSTATSSAPTAAAPSRSMRELLADFGDVRYVWRHLPLSDVHPHARARRRGLRGGGRAGEVLGDARPAARPPGRAAARATCATTPRSSASTSSASTRTCASTRHAPRVEEDVDSADLSGVTGTPTFFVNERRHDGAYDIDSLSARRAGGAGAAADQGLSRSSAGWSSPPNASSGSAPTDEFPGLSWSTG